MNYLIQRGKVRGQVINVPEGLPELLSDITREVLRCQPNSDCLCQFIIDYLHSIIMTREKSRMVKSIIDRAIRTVDEIIEDLCICDIGKMRAEEMALAMEECFKRFLEKRRCEVRQEKEVIRFEEEDMLDELIRRCKFSAADLLITRPVIEEAYHRFVQNYLTAMEGTDGTEALYQYLKERELRRREFLDKKEAAIKIQANYRGYLVRRDMFGERKLSMETEDDDLRHLDEAARKIQKFYRDHIGNKPFLEPEDLPPPLGEICEPESSLRLGGRLGDDVAEEQLEETAEAEGEELAEVETKPEEPAPTEAAPAEAAAPAEEGPPVEESVPIDEATPAEKPVEEVTESSPEISTEPTAAVEGEGEGQTGTGEGGSSGAEPVSTGQIPTEAPTTEPPAEAEPDEEPPEE